MLFQSQIYASFVLVLFSFAVHKISAVNYASVNSADGRFMLQWTYNNSTSMLMFKLRCQTTGWCGVGFTTTNDGKGMKDYDIAVGGVDGMQTYLNDFQSTTTARPPIDTTQDYKFMKASEDNGYTNVEFYRNATTGDNKDVQFMSNTKVWIVWALGDSDTFANHGPSNRAIVSPQHNLIAEAMSATMVKPSTTTPTTKNTGSEAMSATMVMPSTTRALTPTTKNTGSDVGSRVVIYAILALIVCVLHS